ncbi:MAG: UvrB/UvrC motif-containing protein [Bacteroidia bacterium]|nr:UvrB/UvrC motif-containing protein [Bacteroidia bacterium]
MKNRLKIVLTCLFFITGMCALNAQMYSDTKKTEVQLKKKETPEKDSTKSRNVPGFIFSMTAGVNRGITSGNYSIRYEFDDEEGYIYNEYKVKNTFGYRVGTGVALQFKKFILELPVTICVDRFKIPEISETDRLRIGSLEFGLNQYFKFLKGKHYFLIGEYMALHEHFDINSFGLNLGYGYNILKRLNVSLRYQFNFMSLNRSAPMIQAYKGTSTDDYYWMWNNRYNTLQLVAKYDLVHGVSHKKYKNKKSPKKSDNEYEYLNSQNTYTPPPTKVAVDYSGYSDSDLNLALKEANSKSDLDAMLGIQKELDKRKQADEFSKYSYVQLEQELNKALDKEDYKRADMIKKEMAKRDTQKGMPSENKGDSLESKSIEELNKLKEEAVQKEDYDKAKQIQDIINKKKP